MNSAPTITNKLTTPVSVSENVAVGTTVRRYTATDVNGGTLTYSATYNPTSGGTYFSIVSTCKHYLSNFYLYKLIIEHFESLFQKQDLFVKFKVRTYTCFVVIWTASNMFHNSQFISILFISRNVGKDWQQ